MKKVFTNCILVAAFISLILGFMNLIGTITTKLNWTSFSAVIIMAFMSSEQFSKKGDRNKIKNARILGVVMLLAFILNLIVFIKSVLR